MTLNSTPTMDNTMSTDHRETSAGSLSSVVILFYFNALPTRLNFYHSTVRRSAPITVLCCYITRPDVTVTATTWGSPTANKIPMSSQVK